MLKWLLLFFSMNAFADVYRPFGIRRANPPRISGITIVDEKIGIEAKQVCGYTDWTTAQITLPKKILSKTYWKNLGKKIMDEAKHTAMALSGALPGMLACNMSATFCHIFNQAELMAAFENQLTFDSCQILDGVSNISGLQNQLLADCIQKVLAKDQSQTPGQARELCLVTNNGEITKESKNTKIESVIGGGELFKMDEFLLKLYPDKVKTKKGILSTSGNHKYTRSTSTYKMMKDLFPGVTLNSRFVITKGGTFRPTIEKEVQEEAQKIHDEVIIILTEMKKWYDNQYHDEEIIERSSKIWRDKKRWEKEKTLPPIYRESTEGTAPTLLIPPEQILQLVPLSKNTDLIKKLVGQISKLAAHIKVVDRLGDAYTKTLDQCKRDPKYQDSLSQKNCDLILERLMSSLKILEQQRKNEQEVRRLQAEMGAFVRHEITRLERTQRKRQDREMGELPKAKIEIK